MDDRITSIARRELGTAPERVVDVTEGLLHETYELRCDGREYVLQFATDATGDRRDSLHRGLNCYRLLQQSGLPVPEVVAETVGQGGENGYVLVTALPGETGERAISPERTRTAGRYLAEIHSARNFGSAGWLQFGNGKPTVRRFEEGSLRRRLRRTVDENAAVLREAGLVAVGDELDGLVDRLGDRVPESFRPVLCHNDYSPDNVLFRGNDVTGILDFDRACAGHSHRDLVKAANAFWMHDPSADWDVRESFYEGYRETGTTDLGGSFQRCEPLYRVETLADLVAGLLRMDGLSGYEREFYADRLVAAIDRVEEE